MGRRKYIYMENNNMSGVSDYMGMGNDPGFLLFDQLRFQQQYDDPGSYSGLENVVVDRYSLGSLRWEAPELSPTSSVLLLGESSEVVNTPNTPNSVYISDDDGDVVDDHNHHHAPPLSVETREVRGEDGEEKNAQNEDDNFDDKEPKTKKQKREKQPKFAFMTKTEVDHLDDGYRWRKYGQKAVKKSPFPRSYYRCTTPACEVKKRVERSSLDQTIVVTTYVGQHTHPYPIMKRGGINLNPGMGTRSEMMISHPALDQCSTACTAQSVFSIGSAASSSLLHHHHQIQNQYFPFQNHQQQSFTSYLLSPGAPSTMSFTSGGSATTAATTTTDNPVIHDLHIQRHSLNQLKDDGLLQDMVPTQMRNESGKEE